MSIPTSSTSNRGVRGLPDESQTIDNTSRVINRADFAAYQNSLAEKAETRAQGGGEHAGTRGGTDEGETREIDLDGAGGGAGGSSGAA